MPGHRHQWARSRRAAAVGAPGGPQRGMAPGEAGVVFAEAAVSGWQQCLQATRSVEGATSRDIPKGLPRALLGGRRDHRGATARSILTDRRRSARGTPGSRMCSRAGRPQGPPAPLRVERPVTRGGVPPEDGATSTPGSLPARSSEGPPAAQGGLHQNSVRRSPRCSGGSARPRHHLRRALQQGEEGGRFTGGLRGSQLPGPTAHDRPLPPSPHAREAPASRPHRARPGSRDPRPTETPRPCQQLSY